MALNPPINEGFEPVFSNHLILLFFKDNFYKVNLKKSKFSYRGFKTLILKIDFKTVLKSYLEKPNETIVFKTELSRYIYFCIRIYFAGF